MLACAYVMFHVKLNLFVLLIDIYALYNGLVGWLVSLSFSLPLSLSLSLSLSQCLRITKLNLIN